MEIEEVRPRQAAALQGFWLMDSTWIPKLALTAPSGLGSANYGFLDLIGNVWCLAGNHGNRREKLLVLNDRHSYESPSSLSSQHH